MTDTGSESAIGSRGVDSADQITESLRHTAFGERSLLLVLASILATGAAYFVSLQFERTFTIPEKFRTLDAMSATAEELAELSEQNARARAWNVSLCLGLAGATIAGLFGLAAGLGGDAPGSAARRGLTGLGVGVLAGGLLGAIGGYADVTVFQTLQFEQPDFSAIGRTVLAHVIAWGPIAVATGLAVSIGSRSQSAGSAITATLIGAIIGVVLALTLGTILLPLSRPEDPLPEGIALRLMWFGLCTGLMAALLILTAARQAGLGSQPSSAD